MLLTLDIGNTNIVLGIFKGKRLKRNWRIFTNLKSTSDEYWVLIDGLIRTGLREPARIDAAILSSVVPPLTPVIVNMIKEYLGFTPMVVADDLKTGIKICYRNPKEVGSDRIVNATAAFKLYGGPTIVVDLGTATTFCVITKKGEYIGGSIAPGVLTSLEALFQKTARLPKVELIRPDSVIGKDTISSMQAGVVFGYAAMIDGMIARIGEELKIEPYVVATGGLASLIAPESRMVDESRPFLTLEGLRMIFEMNR
ncbi:MAG: type III pantothenate kinase [Nitrospirota bacterium]